MAEKDFESITAPELTKREEDVLNLILTGSTKKLTAEKLNVSFHTVDTHLRKIYTKCGVNNKTELLLFYLRKNR